MKINDVIIETSPERMSGERIRLPTAIRIGSSPPMMTVRASGSRDYLRRLRAAEMAAWEFSGGDYLLSECAHRASAQEYPN